VEVDSCLPWGFKQQTQGQLLLANVPTGIIVIGYNHQNGVHLRLLTNNQDTYFYDASPGMDFDLETIKFVGTVNDKAIVSVWSSGYGQELWSRKFYGSIL